MACLCCIPSRHSQEHIGNESVVSRASFSKPLVARGSSLYQIEQVDADLMTHKSRNAQQLRMQMTLTEELSSETYGLEVAKKGNEKYEAQDFFLFKEIIGSGSTAVVFRAVFKPTGTMQAVKFVPNFRSLKTMVMRELQVLKIANESRFLIDFHSHFRVGPNLYFVMEICEGGTLNDLLNPKHHMPAKLMKVYLKEMASAIFFLHSRKLVHRDISMENFFIDSTGHLKLGDFGLCRMVDDPGGEMMTDCGRPNIKAPELYMDKPCGFPLDWWSLGILLYRFITGFYPFKTEKLVQGYQAVTKHQEKYPEWVFMDLNAKALCQGLLIKKPKERLASENEELEIKGHPYFQDVNWETQEDIVAIAKSLIDTSEDASVQQVAHRLLETLGFDVPRVSFRLASVYPPRKTLCDIPNTPVLSDCSASSQTKSPRTFDFLNLLPKGDGNAERTKADSTSSHFQETTV